MVRFEPQKEHPVLKRATALEREDGCDNSGTDGGCYPWERAEQGQNGRLETQRPSSQNYILTSERMPNIWFPVFKAQKMIMVIHFNSTELSPLPPKAIWSNDIK